MTMLLVNEGVPDAAGFAAVAVPGLEDSAIGPRAWSPGLDEEWDASNLKQAPTLGMRLSLPLEAKGGAVIRIDAGGRVVYMNRTAAALTGWPARLAKGRRLRQVLTLREAQSEPSVDGVEKPNLSPEIERGQGRERAGLFELEKRYGAQAIVEVTIARLGHGCRDSGAVITMQPVAETAAVLAHARLQGSGLATNPLPVT